jgi:hypothetical protein
MRPSTVEPLLNVWNWKGSNPRRPARGWVSIYGFYDLSKNASKFRRAKGRRAKAVLAISKNRQPPTAFFHGQHMKHRYA